MIYRIAQTTSTNDEARDPRYRHGDVVWAEHQTAGRGQRGHVWTSPEGENLTFTLVLEPRFLPVNEQFLLNEAVALALAETFGTFGLDARIKWTNDIYIGDRKAVGMLIENNCSGGRLSRTLAGIGININQTEFDPSLPNPVSMAQVAGHTFDRAEVLDCFLNRCAARYAQLERGENEALQHDYKRHLYRLGELHPYRRPDRTLFDATIEGVHPTGALVLRHTDGTHHAYLFREVEFVINR